jgi:hypothetical protein
VIVSSTQTGCGEVIVFAATNVAVANQRLMLILAPCVERADDAAGMAGSDGSAFGSLSYSSVFERRARVA